MDETERTGQDSLPGTGQASDSKEGTTPGGEPKTYTDKDIQKIISDAKAEAGREAKAAKVEADKAKASLTNTENQLNQTKQQLAVLTKRIDDAELEGARDNPELINLYQQKQDLRRKEAELEEGKTQLAKDKAEHEAEIEVARSTSREILIWGIATKRGVDPVRLKDLSAKFNLQSEEQIEEMAQTISTGKTTPSGVEDKTKPLQPDSGATIGGGELTNEQLEDMPMGQYAAYVNKRDQSK